ncbi:MAG: hypothetical protein GDA56_05160 [Hormoscilla sp. GM7CHS1pb]|nr:hypothetical protein [Hormoscilla sp. GM7CHS1pb]
MGGSVNDEELNLVGLYDRKGRGRKPKFNMAGASHKRVGGEPESTEYQEKKKELKN